MSLSILAVVALPPWHTGAGLVSALVLEGLALRGHRIRALSAITPDARPLAWTPAARPPELRLTWFSVPYWEGFEHAVPDEYRRAEARHIAAWLRAAIDAERPDVLFTGREIYALHVHRVARDAKIPCLVVSHGGPVTSIIRGLWPADRRRQLLDALSAVDAIVSPAQHWAGTLRELGLGRITVIPNPVDLERFAPRLADPALVRQLALAPEDVVVLHASNLQTIKRPLDLVASAELALRRDPRLVYVVVGDGPCREAMERACRGNGLAGRFRFAGWVAHRDVPAYLNLADVIVMMSEHETQALAALEAQACGRLLLASDVPGGREIVRHRETGVLYRTGNVQALADRTVEAAGAPRWRAEVGRRARAAVAAHAAPRIVGLYEGALEALAAG